MKPDWLSADGSIVCYNADALEVLHSLPDKSIDVAVCDPPYSSGGFTRGDRTGDPSEKYVRTGVEIIRDSFSGDNRDGRSWCYWSALWMSEALRVTKPSGRMLMFCDWRQLPLASDAIQAGGFVWRGVLSWDKGPSARAPHKGYFRHQCEFLVWGTSGVSIADSHVPEYSTVADWFFGSGTTAVACIRKRRRFIGCEKDPVIFGEAIERIERELERTPLLADEAVPVQGSLLES
jgi:site-specific DNA-methyltransferase (adenine-specific)